MKKLFSVLLVLAAAFATAMPAAAVMPKHGSTLWDVPVSVGVTPTELVEPSVGSFAAVSDIEDQIVQAALVSPAVAIPEPSGLALIVGGLGFGAFVFRKQPKARDKSGRYQLGARPLPRLS